MLQKEAEKDWQHFLWHRTINFSNFHCSYLFRINVWGSSVNTSFFLVSWHDYAGCKLSKKLFHGALLQSKCQTTGRTPHKFWIASYVEKFNQRLFTLQKKSKWFVANFFPYFRYPVFSKLFFEVMKCYGLHVDCRIQNA